VKTDTRPSVVDSRQGHRNRGRRSEQDRHSHALGNGFIDTFRDHAERHAYLRDRWQGICSDSGDAEYLPNIAASRGKSLETEL
jgi:hypothetical protein